MFPLMLDIVPWICEQEGKYHDSTAGTGVPDHGKRIDTIRPVIRRSTQRRYRFNRESSYEGQSIRGGDSQQKQFFREIFASLRSIYEAMWELCSEYGSYLLSSDVEGAAVDGVASGGGSAVWV